MDVGIRSSPLRHIRFISLLATLGNFFKSGSGKRGFIFVRREHVAV